MDAAEITRAIAAAVAIVSDVDLAVDDAVVLHNSNKLALRLVPADVFARVSRVGEEVAAFEIDLAQRLTAVGAPIVALDRRVPTEVYVRDGCAITLWTYLPPWVTPANTKLVSSAPKTSMLVRPRRTIESRPIEAVLRSA